MQSGLPTITEERRLNNSTPNNIMGISRKRSQEKAMEGVFMAAMSKIDRNINDHSVCESTAHTISCNPNESSPDNEIMDASSLFDMICINEIKLSIPVSDKSEFKQDQSQ